MISIAVWSKPDDDLSPMGNVYWSIVILVLGGCIGSFLNVVIYRWGRDLSVREPARSFCPNCGYTIAWYDNIPVLSYIFLRGRCRSCRVPISLQYPLVELSTAWVFLITYDAFFVAQQRKGIGDMATDWPMLIAHFVLWAGLIALAVMDLEAYVVDIRVTWILTVVGVIAHTFWTPADNMHMQWLRPGPEGAALAISASVGLLIGYVLFLRRPPPFEPELEKDPVAMTESAEPIPAPIETPNHGLRWLCLLICIALLVGYLAVMLTAPPQRPYRGLPRLMTLASDEVIPASRYDLGMIRLAAGLAMAFFGLAAVAAQPHAEADVEIIEAIQSEAPDARAQAFWELKMLSPAVILAILTMILLIWHPESRTWVAKALAWNAVGHWQPLLGLSTGLLGWIMGGVVGWLARIIFTLFFGKEALGMGDVHILAAAGAIAGWPVAFLGFFLAAPLTLLAIAVIHLRRQSRALPYGPWLAMAFLIAAVFQDRILIYMGMRG